MIPDVTDTFNECFVPNWGISMQLSHISMASCKTPFTSFPSITAYFSCLSGIKSFNDMLPSACSMAKSLYPSDFSFFNASQMFS